MTSDTVLFAGVDISPGRRPITIAALDKDLNIVSLAEWTVPEAVASLEESDTHLIVINTSRTRSGQILSADFRREIARAGFSSFSFNPYAREQSRHQWLATNAQECYRAFRSKVLPHRTLEGRIQRSLILYEEGLQIKDPMDYYEEVTRHKLIQGDLPDENIYSPKQLGALISAYAAWLAINRPEDVLIQGETILPKLTENA